MPKQSTNKKLTKKEISDSEKIINSEKIITAPAITILPTENIISINDKFIKALEENKASPEHIAQVLADALHATDEKSDPDYVSRIKAAEMLLKNYQATASTSFLQQENNSPITAPTKEEYAAKAWQRANDSSSLKEDTKYKYFDILGKVLGYFSDAPNTQLLIYNSESMRDSDTLKKKLSNIVGKISQNASA